MRVKVVKKNHYMIVTLNRPEAMNSIDPDTARELDEAFHHFNENEDMWVAILTGAGEKSFCTGSDLKKTVSNGEQNFAVDYFDKPLGYIPKFVDSIKSFKPIICAINGYAIGGGLELALACDLRIASTNASLGLSEVTIGSIAGAGGTQRLPRAIPQAIAMKMLLTGERISAEEAYRVGLISDLVEPEDLLLFAEKLAQKICSNGPIAVRAAKVLVNEGSQMNLNQALMMERFMWGTIRGTEDWNEGRQAFSEKRTPVYTGK